MCAFTATTIDRKRLNVFKQFLSKCSESEATAFCHAFQFPQLLNASSFRFVGSSTWTTLCIKFFFFYDSNGPNKKDRKGHLQMYAQSALTASYSYSGWFLTSSESRRWEMVIRRSSCLCHNHRKFYNVSASYVQMISTLYLNLRMKSFTPMCKSLCQC